MQRKIPLFLCVLFLSVSLSSIIVTATTVTSYVGIDFVESNSGGNSGGGGSSGSDGRPSENHNVPPQPDYVSILDPETPQIDSLGDLPKTGSNFFLSEILFATGALLLIMSKASQRSGRC